MTKLLKTLPFLHSIWFWVVIALVLRLSLFTFQYSGDIGNHLAWAESFKQSSSDFYQRQLPGFTTPNYPPLAIYIFAISEFLYKTSTSLIHALNSSIPLFPSSLVTWVLTKNAHTAFYKLGPIFADLGIGVLLYKLAKNRFHPHLPPLTIAALHLFNPAVIYVSTVWGQIESVTLFFILLSLYFYFSKQKYSYFASHISFTLALLSKQTALWLLPVFVILWLKQTKPNKFLKGLFLQLLLFVITFLPFASVIQSVSTYLSTLTGSSNFVSDAAWNIWHFLLGPGVTDGALVGPVTVRLLSLSLLSFAYLLVLIPLLKNSPFDRVVKALLLLSLAAFFLQTRVHERHLAPALPFLLLIHSEDRPLLASYISLSIFHYANLIWSLGLPFI